MSIPEPELGRVADGVADRVDRLTAIGNGQVPAVVRLAWETLMGTSMHNIPVSVKTDIKAGKP